MWLCLSVILTLLGLSSSKVIYGGKYDFSQTLHLTNSGLDISSYQIRGSAVIDQVHDELLSVKLNDLKLFVNSKKLPPGAYQEKKSALNSAENNIFFIKISDGTIKKLFISSSEDSLTTDLKRSFSSLLQFQLKENERVETDISGTCQTKYEKSESVIKKSKFNCETLLPSFKSDVWSSSANAQRVAEISLTGNQLKSIDYREDYIIKLSIADFVQADVSIEISVKLVEPSNPKVLKTTEISRIISETGKANGIVYEEFDLLPKKPVREVDNKSSGLASVIKENLKFLTDKNFGKASSAIATSKIISSIEGASYNEIYNELKSKSNKKILAHFIDILGAVQTPDAHKAAMKYLNFKSKDYNLDLCERYLWALSTSTYHKKFVIMDLISLMEKDIDDVKLLETIVQTISSMVRKSATHPDNIELHDNVLKLITEKLKSCDKTDDLCHRIYLKALANLKSPKVIDLLIEYVIAGSRSVAVRAMKALYLLGKDHWDDKVLKIAERVYLSNGTFDSSAKIFALDILLESNKPSLYFKLLMPLRERSVSSELKEYLLQRLAQFSKKDAEFETRIKSMIINEGLNTYNTYAQGGLSTAFDRSFMSNGYLSTAQEVKNGLLKQGYVHINLGKHDAPETVFTLGLFSSGLSSFVSDSSDEDENEETTAGLELSVLGVEFRPFLFFQGQGELMGHVFSGAGSTLTPAYQAVLLMKNELAYIPLGTGELLSISLNSIASVDLSGKIEISLWTRAAESLVQNSAGLMTEEIISLDSPLIQLKTAFILTAEPQLKLSSDITFSGQVGLCLQLEQPPLSVQYNTSSVTSVVGKTFKNSKFISRKIMVPGKTYALNSKNNEMCNALFSQ